MAINTHSVRIQADAASPLSVPLTANFFFLERTCQVYRNECLADGSGTVYVTVGTAGANLEAGQISSLARLHALLELIFIPAPDRRLRPCVELQCCAHGTMGLHSCLCNRRKHNCAGLLPVVKFHTDCCTLTCLIAR